MTNRGKKIAAASLSIMLSLSASASGVFEYDGRHGWWWYKETVRKNGKKYEVKTRFSNKEKVILEQKMENNRLLKQQTKLLEDIKTRLEYAFPDLTPKYGVNKKTGEKCLANSSADCFVMPLQPEARRVPVLAKFLSNPSPSNSEDYLKWQATYFNHLSKISYGLRFAYLSKGPEAYPTDMANMYGDNEFSPISDDIRDANQMRILSKLKDKVGIMIFMGATTAVEQASDIYSRVFNYQKGAWKNIPISLVFPDEKIKSMELERFKKMYVMDQRNKDFLERVKIIVNKDLFNKFNVMLTPSAVAVYKKKGKEYIWQNLATGNVRAHEVRKALFRFLVYNSIVDPKELSVVKNAQAVQKNLKVSPVVFDENRIYEDTNKVQIEKTTKQKRRK